MKLGRFMLVAAMAAGLAGCAAPYAKQKHIPSEQLGGHFQAQLLTHKGTQNGVILAVRADNDNGFLKVCGLYLYGGGGDDFATFQKGVVDQNSFVEVGTDKEAKGVRLHAAFLRGHVTQPGAPLDAVGKVEGAPKVDLQKLVIDSRLTNLMADCTVTETPWRPTFATDRFVPNLVITTMSTVWIPVRR
jgi:hypothetical protein